MSELQSANSQKFNGLQQFFALGIDAYHLQLYKHYLDFTPSLGIPGASGKWLTLDSNQIKTKLYWGQYQQGQKSILRSSWIRRYYEILLYGLNHRTFIRMHAQA